MTLSGTTNQPIVNFASLSLLIRLMISFRMTCDCQPIVNFASLSRSLCWMISFSKQECWRKASGVNKIAFFLGRTQPLEWFSSVANFSTIWFIEAIDTTMPSVTLLADTVAKNHPQD